MISARMKSRRDAIETVDMTHVQPGDYFIKIIDESTIAHVIIEEVVSESRFIARLIDKAGIRIGSGFPVSALELSRMHPNTPANQRPSQPRAVNA